MRVTGQCLKKCQLIRCQILFHETSLRGRAFASRCVLSVAGGASDQTVPRGYDERQLLYSRGKLGDHYPPSQTIKQLSPKDLQSLYGSLSREALEQTKVDVMTGGRILAFREVSSKLVFGDVYHDGCKLQIILNSSTTCDFERIIDQLQRGDIVQVRGSLCRTTAGELSVRAVEVFPLTPCLLNIPDIHAPEMTEHHQVQFRHLDLLARPLKLNVFKTRGRLMKLIRDYLDDKGFTEVETPILATSAGGALARPFTTHSDSLNIPLALRIAPELYLKRLIVAGFDRVFEMGKVFRNEGIDSSHNPEFTSLELYQSFASAAEMMELAEDLVCKAFSEFGGEKVEAPFRRIDIVPALESRLGVSFIFSDEKVLAAQLESILEDREISRTSDTLSHMFDRLISSFLEPLCQEPTFLINHPIVQSPLARRLPGRPHLSARFELFVNGKEVMNGYSELNDPFEQRQRFTAQALDRSKGDPEAHIVDEDHIKALEAGMPPTGGLGVGIDRLLMLLTKAKHMRDVLLFPL